MEHIRVLVIEDNPGDARLIQEMLVKAENVSFDLEWKERLSEGLVRLAEGSIDVILLDLMLPDSKGFNTFVRTHSHAPEVPIVLMTSLGDETLATRALREGAQDYLIKGQVDSNLLARAIRYAIERKRSEEMLKKYTAELEEANRLKDIFTDIMRPGLLRLEQIKLDLNKIFRAVVDYYKSDLEKKNLKLEYLAKGESLAMVNPLLEVVFSNLISNAIKYSSQGSKIEVNIIDENMHYRIYVRDWGYGIKDEDKEKLFTRFQRGDKKGIGLAIVKRVVELHGGRVWIEDNPGGGSVFFVRVPKS